MIVGAGFHGECDGLDEGRPVALALRVARHMDVGTQHHHVGDLEPLQQQRQQAQIRGQHIDRERGVGVRPAAQPDIVEGDVAGGKHRNVGIALDHEVEPGHGADLRLHRLAQRIPVQEPGRRKQADQRHAEKRRNRHPQALYSLGYRQRIILVEAAARRRRRVTAEKAGRGAGTP